MIQDVIGINLLWLQHEAMATNAIVSHKSIERPGHRRPRMRV